MHSKKQLFTPIECRGANGGGQGGGASYTDHFDRVQKIEDRGREAQPTEDLQILLCGRLCPAAL